MSVRWNRVAVIGLACVMVWGTFAYGGVAPEDSRQKELSRGGRSKRAAIRQSAALWPGGVVHYQFAAGTDKHTWDVVQNGMRQIEAATAVRFIEDATAPNRLLIRFVPARQGQCGLSSIGRSYPQPQYLTLSCRLTAAAVHELMHALGFDHEEDRHKSSTRKIGNTDPASIMHEVIEGSAVLSQGDIDGINALYPRTAATSEHGRHPSFPVARDDGSLLEAPRSGEAGVYRLKSVNVDRCVQVYGRGGLSPAKPRLVELALCREQEPDQRWRHRADGRIQSAASPEVCLGRGDGAGLRAVPCFDAQSLRWEVRNHRISSRDGHGQDVLPMGTSLALGEAGATGSGPLWYWEPESREHAPRAVSPDPVVPRSPFEARVTENPVGVVLAGSTASPAAVPEGRAFRQLVSVADKRCLAALDSTNTPTPPVHNTLKPLAMQPCNPLLARQNWRREGSGRIANAAYPGWCLGRIAGSAALGRSGRGTASLMMCTDEAVVAWRQDGGRLQDVRFPDVGLSNIHGWTAMERVFPINPAWSQWQWRTSGESRASR